MRSNYNILALFFRWILWHLPGPAIRVTWPVGEVVVEHGQPSWDWAVGAGKQLVMSADPNDHYRPWLEANVGKQGLAWDWKLGPADVSSNMLTVKFRWDKAAYATVFVLKAG